ncbi:MAG: SPOR domain-containing protein [bacterium]
MLNTGRLRAAQEEFLQLLLVNPSHRDAMLGLVMVRRRLAADDPAVLRRQAAAYQQAITRGAETEEHFTVEAMALLAQASLMAAEEIEAERGGPPSTSAGAPPGPPPPSPTQPRPSPRVQAPPTPQPTRQRAAPPAAQAIPRPTRTSPQAVPRAANTPARAPATAAPVPQATAFEPPVDPNEPFLIVRIGPVADAGRVSEIVGELTLAGYSAGVSRRDEPVWFHVISETLTREAAERRGQALLGYGFRSRVIELAGGLALLEFGIFQSADGAEALASRIRTRGYHASVVREGGTGFLITAGPYRQTVANTVARLIRARFGGGLGVSVSAAP